MCSEPRWGFYKIANRHLANRRRIFHREFPMLHTRRTSATASNVSSSAIGSYVLTSYRVFLRQLVYCRCSILRLNLKNAIRENILSYTYSGFNLHFQFFLSFFLFLAFPLFRQRRRETLTHIWYAWQISLRIRGKRELMLCSWRAERAAVSTQCA